MVGFKTKVLLAPPRPVWRPCHDAWRDTLAAKRGRIKVNHIHCNQQRKEGEQGAGNREEEKRQKREGGEKKNA